MVNAALSLLVSIACIPIPAPRRSGYRREWHAEAAVVLESEGRLTALGLMIRVVLGAPATGLAIRHHGGIGEDGARIAIAAVAIPNVYYVAHAAASGQLLLLLPHTALIAGLAIGWFGLWWADRGLFMSYSSRVGIVLAIAAGATITVVTHGGLATNPAIEAQYRIVVGSSLVMVGLFALLCSTFIKRHRTLVVRTGLVVTIIGIGVWCLLGALNTYLADNWWDRAYHSVSIPSLIAVAYACWAALGTPALYHRPEPDDGTVPQSASSA